jgi:hypothetical protein
MWLIEVKQTASIYMIVIKFDVEMFTIHLFQASAEYLVQLSL